MVVPGTVDMDSSAELGGTNVRVALRTWAILGLLLLATMLMYMDRQALAQQKTEILGSLRLSNEDYGRLEQGFGLAFAVGAILTGFIADRISPRWLYPAVLLGWSMVGFATGWVTSYNELFVCRVLLGFFEAGH
jgi:MFS transporter, ACS family, hexuronate transporter